MARVSPRPQLCPLLPSAPPAAGLGEGFRGSERKRKERKSRQTAPSGRPEALHPPRRPVSAGAARSGPPAFTLGSAGPHARPAWAPGPGTVALDGPRTKPRARPGPGPSVPPVRRRREPPPGRGAAEFNRGWWKSGAGAAGWESRRAAGPPRPRASHAHGQTRGRALKGGAEGRGRQRGALPGSGGAAPGAERRSLRSSPRRGSALPGESSSLDTQGGSRPSRSEARSCQANPFSTHPGALNVQTVSGIFPAGAGDILLPLLRGGFYFLFKREMREASHDRTAKENYYS